MAYPGGNGGPIPNYDNYGNPVSPRIGGDGSAPAGNLLAMPPQAPPMQQGVLGVQMGGNGIAPNGQPMPAGDFPGNVQGQDLGVPPGQVLYEDGSTGMPGATPTEAAAVASAPVQSAWSLALQQRMANGGIGSPMDFYNFVRNRGAMPTPDSAAPAQMMMQRQPRPLVIGPTNSTPAQIIPQSAPQGVVPPMPQAPANAPVNAPVNVRPNVPAPGQMPNPQMPGFFPQGKGLVR